jgi:hypothetical protein
VRFVFAKRYRRSGLPSPYVAGAALATTLFAFPARADDHDIAAPIEPERHAAAAYGTSGLALLAGIGVQHGIFGGSIAYYVHIEGTAWNLAPFVSLGSFPYQDSGSSLVTATGLAVAYGRRHRLIADVGIGAVIEERLYLHVRAVDHRALYGVETGLGYEYMAASGFTFRVLPLGIAYPIDPRTPSQGRVAGYSPALAIGWKLW